MTAKVFRSDLIHLHLIHSGFFSILFLPLLTRLRPTVWTMHDPWIVTGRCHYPLGCNGWRTGCGVCPDLGTFPPQLRDHSAFMWSIKKIVYKLSRFEIIVASEHMAQMAKSSPLLVGKKIHVVPFGLDLDVFAPASRSAARQRLGVIPGSHVVAFRINRSRLKGQQYLLEALRLLRPERPLCLISFEVRGMLDEFRGRYQIIELGWVNDESVLNDAYNAADLFLMPSIEEAFGMMAMESMACGTPVIAFDGTALPEVIQSPKGGWVVPNGSAKDLAVAIQKALESPEELKQKKIDARAVAESRYRLDLHVNNLLNVYNGAFRRWHGLER